MSRILIYHGVDEKGGYGKNTRFIKKDNFEAQIRFFNDYFDLVPLEKLIKEEKADRRKFQMALTFDDGYACLYDNALPILRKYRVPATFFITTPKAIESNLEAENENPNAGSGPILWPDELDLLLSQRKKIIIWGGKTWKKGKWGEFWLQPDAKTTHVGLHLKMACKTFSFTEIGFLLRTLRAESSDYVTLLENHRPWWNLLNKAQLKEVAQDPLFEIGSHGCTHVSLDHLNPTNLAYELKASKFWLEKICETEVTQLAYPDGRYNQQVEKIALETGYTTLLGVESPNLGTTATHNRLGVNPFAGPKEQVYAILKGGYQ